MTALQAALSVIVALLTISGALVAAVKWVVKENQMRDEVVEQIKIMNVENQVLCVSLFACLDGLEQLGCNHNVTKTRQALEKHINRRAHGGLSNFGGDSDELSQKN